MRPFPRLAKATAGTDWCLHARNALLAYCNHGPDSRTFATCQDLDAMSDEAVDELLTRFVTMSEEDRQEAGMCTCPPFLRRAFELGKARQAREEKRKRSTKSMLSTLRQKVHYVFDDESVPHWTELSFDAMSLEQRSEASEAWKHAEAEVLEAEKKGISANDLLQHPSKIRLQIRQAMF